MRGHLTCAQNNQLGLDAVMKYDAVTFLTNQEGRRHEALASAQRHFMHYAKFMLRVLRKADASFVQRSKSFFSQGQNPEATWHVGELVAELATDLSQTSIESCVRIFCVRRLSPYGSISRVSQQRFAREWRKSEKSRSLF